MRSALEQAERPERSCCCAPWCPQPCAGAAGRATPAAAPIPALTAFQRASKHTEIFWGRECVGAQSLAESNSVKLLQKENCGRSIRGPL